MGDKPGANSVNLPRRPGRLLLSPLVCLSLFSNNGCGHRPEPTPFTVLRTDFSSSSAIDAADMPRTGFQQVSLPEWQRCENLYRGDTSDSRVNAGSRDLVLIVSTLAAPGTMSRFEISLGATPGAQLSQMMESSSPEMSEPLPDPARNLAADVAVLARSELPPVFAGNAIATVSREAEAGLPAENEPSTALANVPQLAAESRRWLEVPCPVSDSGRAGLPGLPCRWTPVPCRAVLTGDRVRIWSPEGEASGPADLRRCQELLQLVEHDLLPLIEDDQGVWPDIDDDGLINLLVTGSVSRLDPTLKAFVRRQSFQIQSPSPSSAPFDLIYVDQGTDLTHLRPILLHELTHLIEFSWCHQLCAEKPWPLPDWLTEGLAHAAEMRCDASWTNVGNRLSAFATRPALSPLVVMDSATSGLWRDPQQRGATAAFCYWWQQRYPAIRWSQLIDAFQTADDPWAAVCGESFPDLYRQWTISLALDGIPVGGDGLCTPVPIRSLSPARPESVILRGTASAWFRIPAGAVLPDEAIVQVRGVEPQNLQLTLLPLPQAVGTLQPR